MDKNSIKWKCAKEIADAYFAPVREASDFEIEQVIYLIDENPRFNHENAIIKALLVFAQGWQACKKIESMFPGAV